MSLAACAADGKSGWWLGLMPSAGAATTTPADEGSVFGSYLAARYALDRGDLREAARGFERALAADPDNLELRRQVFALLLASGEFERAIPTAEILVQANSSADDAQLFLALERSRRGNYAEARRFLEEVGQRGLTGAVQPILLAWARFGEGARDEAIQSLAAGGGPAGGLDRLKAYHRAMMLALSGRSQQALDLLNTTFPNLPEAPPRIIRAAAQLRMATGDRAGAEGLVADARADEPDERQLEWLADAIAQGRTDVAAIKDPLSGMSDALIGIAEALSEQEGGAQALLFARLAAFVTPEDGDAWFMIGRVALDQNDPNEAIRALERVPAASPLAWPARLLQARALQDLDRVDEAAALYERMASEMPDRADPLVALGDLLRSKERFAEAEAAYGRAIPRLKEGNRQNWRVFYARGIAYERTKRWPQAEADLLKALELEPEQPFVLNYLGYSWVDQGLNLDRAKEMLHRAVELRPEDGFIVDSLGWAYFRLGEFDKAVTYLERAVELEPGDPVINDHLGDAYWRVGRTREARFQWERALTFKPEPDVVASIQEKLARGLPDVAQKPG